MSAEPTLPQLGDPDSELSTIESLLPYFPDDSDKTKYLSYRASGFTIKESLSLVGITSDMRWKWMVGDKRFHYLETHINDARETLGANYAFADFLRNFRLAMEKDFRVLSRAVAEERGAGPELSARDQTYLNRIRSLYTPDQLSKIRQLLLGQGDAQTTNINFTQMVLQIARERR